MSKARTNDVERQIDALVKMTTGGLVEMYETRCKRPCKTRHRAYLIRKIAWRIQADAEGDLSERALKRAAELADDAEVRTTAPKGYVSPPQRGEPRTTTRIVNTAPEPDPRLPAVGSAIVRPYKGKTLRVMVLDDGFEFDGVRYKTLSAVAKHITGGHVNGFRFFNLTGERK